MTAITATMVKDLREKTGAGMMDCKAALNETAGDMEAAVDWLRTKGLAKAAKKAGRVAAEGLIGLAADDKQAALVEVNSETDFVARNDKFQEMVRDHRRRRAQSQGRSRQARQGASMAAARSRVDRSPEGDDRLDRREHDAPPHRLSRREERRGRELHAQHDFARPRQDRRHRRARIRPATPTSSRASASRWRCISPPPIRKASMSPVSIRLLSSASARC